MLVTSDAHKEIKHFYNKRNFLSLPHKDVHKLHLIKRNDGKLLNVLTEIYLIVNVVTTASRRLLYEETSHMRFLARFSTQTVFKSCRTGITLGPWELD